VTWLLPPLTLGLALAASAALASDAQQLARAVRSFYDDGAAVALEQLAPLAEASPERDDLAWWAARCELELGRAAEADRRLQGRDGENIPAWRFAALEAWAALELGADGRARERVAATLASASTEEAQERLLVQTRWIAAGLAVRSEQRARAVELLVGLREAEPPPLGVRAALPELDAVLAAPLLPERELSAPLLLQAQGRWWSLPAGGGLATASSAPEPAVSTCDGPDLCTPDGAPVLPTPGVRFSARLSEGWVYYAAGREPMDPRPEEAGLFRWASTGGSERLCATAPGQQDLLPTPGPGGSLFFLRSGADGVRLMRRERDGELVTLAPDLLAIHDLEVIGEQVLLAALVEGEPRLRGLSVQAGPEESSVELLAVPLEVWALGSP
jgi:hypothetical protein